MAMLTARAAQRILEPLGAAWLDQGASALSLEIEGATLAAVGAEGGSQGADAEILSGRTPIGRLRVQGIAGPAVARRLDADAALLGSMLSIEDQLQRMTAELADTQDQLVAVFDLARAAKGRIEIDDVLTTLVDQASELTQARFAFAVFDDGHERRRVSAPDGLGLQQSVVNQIFGSLQATGRSLLVSTGDAPPAGIDLPPEITGMIAAPVLIEGEVKAILGVAREGGRDFTAGARTLLESIGAQAGSLIEGTIAVQQALVRQRIQKDMELASAVQRSLIVRDLPAIEGASLAGRYIPAAEIGGDLYDLFRRDDGKLVVTVADVTGKGIPAALVMSMTRMALHGAASKMPDPAAALNEVNRGLYDELTDLSKFVTAFMAFYDPARQLLEVANCGHSPVAYCPAEGPARLLEADGPPIGVLDWDVTELQTEPLGPNDVLAIGTDGISEAESRDGAMYGYDRLLEVIEANRESDAGAIADAILESVRCFSDGVAQADDQALVVLKGAAS